jgi:hypothetical protein
MRHPDGYDYTDNFDGKYVDSIGTFYFNLKSIVETGGAQERSLRDVYHMIKQQVSVVNDKPTVHFINILDGKKCSQRMPLLRNCLPVDCKRIYVGDSYHFSLWWIKIHLKSVYTKSNDILLREMSLLSL